MRINPEAYFNQDVEPKRFTQVEVVQPQLVTQEFTQSDKTFLFLVLGMVTVAAIAAVAIIALTRKK